MTDVELKRSALLAFLVQNSPLLISDQTLNIVHFEFKNWHSLLILLNHVLLALNAIQHFFLGCDFWLISQCTSIWFHHWLSNTNCFFVRTRVIIHQPQSIVDAFIFSEICFHCFKLFGKFTKRTYQQNRSILHKRSILSAFQDFTGLITSY